MAKVDLKKIRADLLGKKQELEKQLKKHSKDFDLVEKMRYKNVIAQVGAAHLFLKHIDCDPPNMSFEFPPIPHSLRLEKMKQAARRKKPARKRR